MWENYLPNPISEKVFGVSIKTTARKSVSEATTETKAVQIIDYYRNLYEGVGYIQYVGNDRYRAIFEYA